MIAVAQHHRAELIEIVRRAVEVAVLVHHEQAVAVARVEQFRRGRIMRGAIGVAAEILQAAYTEILERVRHRDADAGVILMITRAFEFDRLVVQEKTFVGVEADRTEATRHARLIGERTRA